MIIAWFAKGYPNQVTHMRWLTNILTLKELHEGTPPFLNKKKKKKKVKCLDSKVLPGSLEGAR